MAAVIEVKNTFVDIPTRRPSMVADMNRRKTSPLVSLQLDATPTPVTSSPASGPRASVVTVSPPVIAHNAPPRKVSVTFSPPATLQASPQLPLPSRQRLTTVGSVVSPVGSSTSRRRLSWDMPMTPDALVSNYDYNFGDVGATATTALAPTSSIPAGPAPYPASAQPGEVGAFVPWPNGGAAMVPMPMAAMPNVAQSVAMPFNMLPYPYSAVQGVSLSAIHAQARQVLDLGHLVQPGLVSTSGTVVAPAAVPMAMVAQPTCPTNGREPVTTVMLRNIPVKYNRETMLADMDQRGFRGSYDFFYLPIDFQTGNTVGYAFVNFISEADANRFRQVYNGLQLSPESAKICVVGDAKAQGRDKNVEQYRNSSVMSMEERFKPLIFENGVRVPFPAPTRSLKPVKPRQRMGA